MGEGLKNDFLKCVLKGFMAAFTIFKGDSRSFYWCFLSCWLQLPNKKGLAVRTTINHTILLTKILNYELNHNLIPKPYQTRRFILLREHKKMYNILYKYFYHGKSIRYVLYSKDHQNSTKVFILVVKYQL